MDDVDGTMLPGGNVPTHWYDTWDRQSSQTFTNAAKGLRNAPGENNCFLNSAVQVFWHIDVFRRSYRRLSGHLCMGHSCIFCALKVIFTQFQYSDQSSLQPNALRKALASTFAKQERFQLGHMDDAAECFENILHRIHYHIANTYNEDTCNAPHCIPHQKFAMTVCDQLVCPCGATNEPHKFHEMVHYISANALVAQSRAMQETGDMLHPDRFGLLLRNAGAVGNVRDCPGNCGKRIQIRRTLLNVPDVISIGLVWGSDRPDMELTTEVARAIGTGLLLPDIFHSVMCSENRQLPRLQLSALVCYYGKHYSTFVWHTKLGMWVYFDDATVKEIGTRWEDVVSKCIQGRYQPLLLIYTNPAAVPVSTETAPCTRVMAPGYSMTPGKEEKNSSKPPPEPEKTGGKTRRSLTPSLDSTDGKQSSKQTGSSDKSSGEKELARKSSFEHRRQSSFLIAVKSNTQKENHYQIPHNNRVIQSQAGRRILEQMEGRNSVKSPVNVSEVDEDSYNYTLSTSDQYRRPGLTNQDVNNIPVAINFSRTNDTRKDSFKKGKQNVPADVVRYHMDPSRRPSQSSDSDQSSPPCVEPDIAPSHHQRGKHIRTRSQSLEDNLGNVSDTGGSGHKVVKPKPSSASMFENDCVTRAHTPVQSGLATLPRKKKSDNMNSSSSHNATALGSQHNEVSHPHQNSQTLAANMQYSNYPPHPHSNDDTNYQNTVKYQNALTYQNVVDTDLHSRQSSTSSLLSSGTVVECPVGINADSGPHNRQSSSISQDTLTGIEMKDKSEKSKESKPKSKRKDEKRTKAKKEKRNSSGKPPPGPEKVDKKPKDEGFAEDNSYIDRKMVESVLSFQKLQRSGSCVSQASTSSIESESNNKSHGITPKDNLSSEIPFDTTSLDSHKDSGYGSSDRNSSSSTGSITMNPYEQYFLSRSMIPPKTFNHQVMAENMRKLMDQGAGPAGLGYTQEKDLKSIVVNPSEQFNQNITVGHCQNGNYPTHFTQIAEVPSQPSTPRDITSLPKDERNQQIMNALNKQGPKPVPPPKVAPSGAKGLPQAVLPNKQQIGVLQKPSYPGMNGGNPVVQTWNNLQTNNGLPPGNGGQQRPADGVAQQHQRNGSDEALNCGNGEFLALCQNAEDYMDECVLAETSEQYGDALHSCQHAIDHLKSAMRLPGIGQSSYTYAQRKSNSCILKLRSLQKRLMLRQESNTSTNSSDSGHQDHRNQKPHPHPPTRSQPPASVANHTVRPPSRSSSLNSMDSARDGSITSTCSSGRSATPVFEGNKPPTRPPVDSRVPPPEYHNTYNKDRSFETNIPEGTTADLYGTLPRRKTQKSQEHSTNNQQHEQEVYQDFLDNQRRQNVNQQNLMQQNMSHNQNLTQQNVCNNRNLTQQNVCNNQNLTQQSVSNHQNVTHQNVSNYQNLTQNLSHQQNLTRAPEKSPFAAGPSVRNHLKMHSMKNGVGQVRQLSQLDTTMASANEQRSQFAGSRPTVPVKIKQQTTVHPESQPELRNIHAVESSNNCAPPTTGKDELAHTNRPVVSVRDLASRFETSTGISKPDSQAVDPNDNGHIMLGPVSSAPNDDVSTFGDRVAIQRQRSKSESEFLDSKPTKPRSVLAKKSKKGTTTTRKMRKSVTFSASVCLVEAANEWGVVPSNDHMTEAGYQSDEEGRNRAGENDTGNDDDSSSTDSPVEIFGDAACILCHKKGVISGQNYCEKCTFYMSRFTPTR